MAEGMAWLMAIQNPEHKGASQSVPSLSTVIEKRTTQDVSRSHYGGALAEFAAAPESVQRAFWQAVAKQAEAETDFSRYLAELEDGDPVPPAQPANRLPRRSVCWSDSWRRRARGARAAASVAGRDFDLERQHLLTIEAVDYVRALTGEEPRFGKVACVLPGHDERTASMQVYPDGGGWYCFGCGKGGDVYDLGGFLWELEPRSPDFREIHDRLVRALS